VKPQIEPISHRKRLILIILILQVFMLSKVYTKNKNKFRVISKKKYLKKHTNLVPKLFSSKQS